MKIIYKNLYCLSLALLSLSLHAKKTPDAIIAYDIVGTQHAHVVCPNKEHKKRCPDTQLQGGTKVFFNQAGLSGIGRFRSCEISDYHASNEVCELPFTNDEYLIRSELYPLASGTELTREMIYDTIHILKKGVQNPTCFRLDFDTISLNREMPVIYIYEKTEDGFYCENGSLHLIDPEVENCVILNLSAWHKPAFGPTCFNAEDAHNKDNDFSDSKDSSGFLSSLYQRFISDGSAALDFGNAWMLNVYEGNKIIFHHILADNAQDPICIPPNTLEAGKSYTLESTLLKENFVQVFEGPEEYPRVSPVWFVDSLSTRLDIKTATAETRDQANRGTM